MNRQISVGLTQDFRKLRASLNLKLKTMGVMNVTPDSFSDGGELSLYEDFRRRFKEQLRTFDIIDIGAESTAPFNSAIDSSLELERFENTLIPLLFDMKDPECVLSIDSYKPEVFYELALLINKKWPKTKILFNDISGKIDDELTALFKENLRFDYILCHNLSPRRTDSSKHMDYLCSSERLLDNVENFFSEGFYKLKDFKGKIWADPCFGFSKSYEQNHMLIKQLPQMKCFDRYAGILLGLSRKSFLRIPKTLSPKKSEELAVIEQVHGNMLVSLISKLKRKNLVVRTHDLRPVYSSLCSLRILS